MTKKKVKKKSKVSSKKRSTTLSTSAVDRLIDSNIEMQHKMIDVMISVKELNENVGNLVDIFKSAGDHIKSGKYEDPMINRLNDLLEQNKGLVKALTKLEEFVKDKKPEALVKPLSPTQY